MQKQFLTAAEVAEMCSVSISTGYKVIRELNAELSKKGYLTFSGRVPAKYLQERIYGGDPDGSGQGATV